MPRSSDRVRPTNVLLVDQGLSFGGALVVLVSIAKNLGPQFNATLVTAIQGDVQKWIDTGNVPVYSCTPDYTYVDHFREQTKAGKLPTWFAKKLYIYLASALGFLLNLKYTYRIFRIIRSNNIDVVHVNNSVFVVLAAALGGAKAVWHFHGIPVRPPTLWERILRPWIGRYLSISEYVTQAAVKQGYPEAKLITVKNPVIDSFVGDTDAQVREKIRMQLSVREDEFLVAVFGRIIKWKGQLEAIKAWAHLQERKDIKLMLVGDASEGFGSNYKQQIIQFAADNGLQDRLLLTGFVRDVSAYYQASDLVIHSSIEPEPFGLVVIEAMASQRPVIVSDRGAPPELVEPGIDGFVVDPCDDRRIAETIVALADEPERCRQMGQRGLSKVQELFMPDVYARQMEALYTSLLAESSPE